jgi:hypothetical protein
VRAIYETANTGKTLTDLESIKAKAIELLNAPRTWGRSTNQTLSDIVGAALVKASPTTLPSETFERLRNQILTTLRTPKHR